jgi:DNA-directed RNA polymerase specialized sigma24 family protein
MDQASIDILYRTYGNMVQRRARVLLGDEYAAQDMVQEVFMKAIRAFPSFRGESSLTTWLYQVTTNHCLNVLRDGARRRRARSSGDCRRRPSIRRRPRTGSASTSFCRSCRASCARSPSIYHVDQMNQDEIAALLGTSERTVRNRLKEFRDAAHDQLQIGPEEAFG